MTTILVIEDEVDIREEILEVLMFEDFEAIEAENGEIGIQKALDHLPDLIICDVNMPLMNGFDVLSELQSLPQTRAIPFIFLTALSHHDDIRTGMQLGADDYITKPFTFSTLLSAVRTRLDKRRQQEVRLLRDFSRHLVRSQDAHRRRWAERIKDDVAEPMTQLRFLLSSLHRLLPEALGASVDNINDLLGSIIDQVDTVQSDLWPTFIEHLGLVAALSWYVNLFAEKSEVRVAFHHDGLSREIPAHIATNVYFLVQEALNNIAEHAQAKAATLTLHMRDGHLHGEIVDLGVGFDPQAVAERTSGYGLINMQERLRYLGGHLEIIAAPEVGTTLRFAIPLYDAEQAAPSPVSRLTADRPAASPVAPPPRPASDDVIDIMIADDHHLIRLGLQQIIESQADLRVSANATDGRTLLKMLETESPTLLVMDLDLPPHQGSTLIRLLAQQHPQLPIVVLSPTKQSVFAWEALQSGAQACVLKQAADTELLEAIHKVRQHERYISPAISLDAAPAQTHRQAASEKNRLNDLTPREREILEYVAQDYQNSEIAEVLTISIRTVETHRANMMRKLDLHNKTELLRYALKHGITSLDP